MKKQQVNMTLDEATITFIDRIAKDENLGYGGNRSLAVRHIIREFKSK
jgi:hypothetical protein